MPRLTIFLLQFFCAVSLTAQVFQTNYYGETKGSDLYAQHLAALPDGGSVITGTSNIIDSGGYRVLLLRTSSDGTILWQRTYHQGSGAWVAAANDGGFVVGGTSERHPFGTDQGFIMKVNVSGVEEWKQFLPFGNHLTVICAKPLASGGFVVCGHVTQPDTNAQDVFWATFTSDGALSNYNQEGDSDIDHAYDILENQSGNFVLSWKSSHESLLSCFQPNGQLVWERNLQDQDKYEYGTELSVVEDSTGDIWVAGGYNFMNITYDPQILQFSGNGILKHQITYEAAGFGPKTLVVAPNGSVSLYFANNYLGDLIHLKLSAQGTIDSRDSVFWGAIRAGQMAIQGESRIFLLQGNFFEGHGITIQPIQQSGNTFSLSSPWMISTSPPYSNEYYQNSCRSADGGFFVLGRIQTGVLYGLGYFILRTNHDGQEIARTPFSDGYSSSGGQIQLLSDGGAIVLNPAGQAWKVDAQAKLVWSKMLKPGLLLTDQKNGFVIVGKHYQVTPTDDTHLWHYDRNGDLIDEKTIVEVGKKAFIFAGVSRLGGGFTLWGKYYEASDNTLRNWIVYLNDKGAIVSDVVLGSEYTPLSYDSKFIQTASGDILGASLQYGQDESSIYMIQVNGHTPVWDYRLFASPSGPLQMSLNSIEEIPCKGFVVAIESAPSIQPFSNKIILLHYIDALGTGKDFFSFKPLPFSASLDSTFLPDYAYRQWGNELHGQTQDLYLRTVYFPDTNHVSNPSADLSIMPNPSGQHICLKYTSSTFGLMEIAISDAAGRLVDRFKSDKKESVWSFDYSANYPSGTYFIQLKIGEDERVVQRWVKAQ